MLCDIVQSFFFLLNHLLLPVNTLLLVSQDPNYEYLRTDVRSLVQMSSLCKVTGHLGQW